MSEGWLKPNGIIESREVLAGAYVNKDGSMLRHGVFVRPDRGVVEPLCRRVKVDSLADRNAGNPLELPDCPDCLKALARIERQRHEHP